MIENSPKSLQATILENSSCCASFHLISFITNIQVNQNLIKISVRFWIQIITILLNLHCFVFKLIFKKKLPVNWIFLTFFILLNTLSAETKKIKFLPPYLFWFNSIQINYCCIHRFKYSIVQFQFESTKSKMKFFKTNFDPKHIQLIICFEQIQKINSFSIHSTSVR